MTRLAVALVCAALALAGCGKDDAPPQVGLDTSPRVADDQGVVTQVSLDEVTLDGKRSYKVSDSLRSFSTYDRELQPLLGFKNRYVHLGLHKGKVVWLAGIGAVVQTPSPAVFYSGTLRRVDDKRRLVFGDGTVLPLADGVAPPPAGQVVQARIDPAHGRVAGFVGQ